MDLDAGWGWYKPEVHQKLEHHSLEDFAEEAFAVQEVMAAEQEEELAVRDHSEEDFGEEDFAVQEVEAPVQEEEWAVREVLGAGQE